MQKTGLLFTAFILAGTIPGRAKQESQYAMMQCRSWETVTTLWDGPTLRVAKEIGNVSCTQSVTVLSTWTCLGQVDDVGDRESPSAKRT
jgi:hypothetical protein